MTVPTLSSALRALGPQMRAMRFHGPGKLSLDTLPVPDPQAGELRLRPLAVGICGTDAHIFHVFEAEILKPTHDSLSLGIKQFFERHHLYLDVVGHEVLFLKAKDRTT